jgi:hypothetical protein
VHVNRFEDQNAAMITVRAAVRLSPCIGADDSCVPVSENIPTVDIAVAFASSLAAQAAVSGSKCASLACMDAVLQNMDIAVIDT